MTDGPAVPATQPHSYAWIEDTVWGVHCCVTVVTETSTARVSTVLGLAGVPPKTRHDCDDLGTAYGIVEPGSGSVLIVRLFEHFDDDIAGLARPGRLGRFSWNEGLSLLTLARAGELLESFEPLLERPENSEVAATLAGIDFSPTGYPANVLLAIERFTGAGFTRGDMARVDHDRCWYERPSDAGAGGQGPQVEAEHRGHC